MDSANENDKTIDNAISSDNSNDNDSANSNKISDNTDNTMMMMIIIKI